MINGKKKTMTYLVLGTCLLGMAGCQTSQEAAPEVKKMQEYASKDGTFTIDLPGSGWKLEEDSEELRIFSSNDGLVMMTHTEDASEEMNPKTESELKMLLDIEGYSSDDYEVVEFETMEVASMRSYDAVIQYTDANAMYSSGVLHSVILDDDVYMASAMLTDDSLVEQMKTSLSGYEWEIKPKAEEPVLSPGDEKETPAPTPTPDAETAADLTKEAAPTKAPTPEPTKAPTPEPTEEPTPEPTEEPTEEPTPEPTPEPTEEPTPEPTEEPTPEPTPEPSSGSGRVCHSAAYVRSEPNNSSTVIGSVAAGDSLNVTGEVRNWYQISFNGQTAYVCKDFVQ